MIVLFVIFLLVIFIVAVRVTVLWQVRKALLPAGTDQLQKQKELNAVLKDTGFAYEKNGDYFYSLMNCWQRDMGYCRLYDEAAPLFNMVMDCEPIPFSYGGKRWLIELWKGQYGITTGGEIGIYNTEKEDIDADRFRGTFYESVSDNEMLGLSFVLKKKGKVILRRKAVHWWLTGFKLGEFSDPDELTMDAEIAFPNREMRDVFLTSLRALGYGKKEFAVRKHTVKIHYVNPRSKQPESQEGQQEMLVQKINQGNCYLYRRVTRKYADTLDKLEYIRAMMPELFEIFVGALYAKGVYEAFGWIKGEKENRYQMEFPEVPELEDDCECEDDYDWEYPFGC